MSLEQPGPVHQRGYDHGAADADAVELTPEMKSAFISPDLPDPDELSPQSPLLKVGDDLSSLVGAGYAEDDPEKYEQGYLLGWEERLLQRSMSD